MGSCEPQGDLNLLNTCYGRHAARTARISRKVQMSALHRFPRPRIDASDVPLPYRHFAVRRSITAESHFVGQRKGFSGRRASRANRFGSTSVEAAGCHQTLRGCPLSPKSAMLGSATLCSQEVGLDSRPPPLPHGVTRCCAVGLAGWPPAARLGRQQAIYCSQQTLHSRLAWRASCLANQPKWRSGGRNLRDSPK